MELPTQEDHKAPGLTLGRASSWLAPEGEDASRSLPGLSTRASSCPETDWVRPRTGGNVLGPGVALSSVIKWHSGCIPSLTLCPSTLCLADSV